MGRTIYRSDDHNRIKTQLSGFWFTYKYQIISTSILLVVLCGVLFGTRIKKSAHQDDPVVITKAEPTISDENVSKIVVDIAGAVVNPGVYEVSAGSRVRAVLDLAGGFSDVVNTEWVSKALNQAEVLSDGQKIFIPSVNDEELVETFTTETVSRGSQLINLNTASSEELERLPGIGPSYAERIIAARPFSTVEELLLVPGIGEKRFQELEALVTIQ